MLGIDLFPLSHRSALGTLNSSVHLIYYFICIMIICEQGSFYSAKGRGTRKFVIYCREEGTVNNDDDLVVCVLVPFHS